MSEELNHRRNFFIQEQKTFCGNKLWAHPHPNGGGWVANSARVSFSVKVDQDSIVWDNAVVFGQVEIINGSKVCGDSIVMGRGIIDATEINDKSVVLGKPITGSNDAIKNSRTGGIVTGEVTSVGSVGYNAAYNYSGKMELLPEPPTEPQPQIMGAITDSDGQTIQWKASEGDADPVAPTAAFDWRQI